MTGERGVSGSEPVNQDAASLEHLAELLRLADFALERANAALVAFGEDNHIVSRTFDRNMEVRREIAATLVHLPPEPPLTSEQEAEAAAVLRRVMESSAVDALSGLLRKDRRD